MKIFCGVIVAAFCVGLILAADNDQSKKDSSEKKEVSVDFSKYIFCHHKFFSID